MMASNTTPSNGPLSVEEIGKQAANFDYTTLVPLRYWLRSANTMQQQAHIYESEGDDSQTYLLLLRHAILVLEKIPEHPEVKDSKIAQALADARKAVGRNFKRLEDLKPRIEKRNSRYQEIRKKRNAQSQAQRANSTQYDKIEGLEQDLSSMALQSGDGSADAFFGQKQTLDASEHKDLAAKLAQREWRRRSGVRRAAQGASSLGQADDLSKQIQEASRRHADLSYGRTSEFPVRQSSRQGAYRYPTVPPKSERSLHTSSHYEPALPDKVYDPYSGPHLQDGAVPPRPPPKPPGLNESGVQARPPPVPGKYAELHTPSAESYEIKPSDYTFKPSAYLENGEPLRPMYLPSGIYSKFLLVAANNTRLNLETCGILCGTLLSNALFITKLVIPEQKSTSDTCETLNEEALWAYCEEENVIQLGWIHTHPTQTCFMSSRDLHTHSAYQCQLPESIAIVCAPSKSESTGVFRLTNPPGLQTLLSCTKPGIFHEHDTPRTHTSALKPGGHVVEHPTMELEVKDLRP